MALRTSQTLSLALALATGACFSGTFLAGQPCSDNSECGPNLTCQDGLCGGATGATAQTTSTSTTTPATTSTSTSTTSTSTSTTTSALTSTSTSSTSGEETEGTSTTTGDLCGIGRCTDVDFLVIIDNSPSMGDKSDTLLAMMLSFINHALPVLNEACSLHLGFVTTDAFQPNPEECRELGALVRADNDGDPCPFVEGHPYATRADLSMPASLACVATVGSDGSPNEQPFDALLEVFDPQLNSGCNDNFLRPEALLVIIVATDEDDGDVDDPQGHSGSTSLAVPLWYDALVGLKGGTDNLYVAALLGDEDQETTACPWDPLAGPDGTGASPAPVLRQLVKKFPEDHYTIESICHPDAVPDDFVPLMETLLEEIDVVCEAP